MFLASYCLQRVFTDFGCEGFGSYRGDKTVPPVGDTGHSANAGSLFLFFSSFSFSKRAKHVNEKLRARWLKFTNSLPSSFTMYPLSSIDLYPKNVDAKKRTYLCQNVFKKYHTIQFSFFIMDKVISLIVQLSFCHQVKLSGHLWWCNGKQARLANLHKYVRVSLGAF